MKWFDYIKGKAAEYFITSAPEDRIRIEAAKRMGGTAPSGGLELVGRDMEPQAFREWKDAITYASDPENPDRSALANVYGAMRRDGHLMAVVMSRVLRVQRAAFSIVDENGEDTELDKLLDGGWFETFVACAMMSIFEGTKLVELFELDEEGKLRCSTEIPMGHVNTTKGIIAKEQGGDKGWSYRDGKLAAYYVQIGGNRDLGLFADIAPLSISKRIARGGWLSFIDKFGTPPVVVTTEDRTVERQRKLLAMLRNLTSSHYGILQGQEQLNVLNNTQTDAHDVFNEFMERCNSEMSKRVLGATGTTDEKSFVGAAQVHQETANYRHESDKLFVQRIINEELLPRLANLSPYYAPLAGKRFQYDNSDELSRAQIIDAAARLGNIYEMDVEVLAEKTGLPIISMKLDVQPEPQPDKGKKAGAGA